MNGQGISAPAAAACEERRSEEELVERVAGVDERLLFARGGTDSAVAQGVVEMEALERAAAVFRSHPTYRAPDRFLRTLRALLDSSSLSALT